MSEGFICCRKAYGARLCSVCGMCVTRMPHAANGAPLCSRGSIFGLQRHGFAPVFISLHHKTVHTVTTNPRKLSAMKNARIMTILFVFAALVSSLRAVADGNFQWVAGEGLLADGDTVVVVCRDSSVAMGSIDKYGRFMPVPVAFSPDGESLELAGDGVVLLKLKKYAKYWMLQTLDGKWVSAKKGNNYNLELKDGKSDDKLDNVTLGFDDDGNALVDFKDAYYSRLKYNGNSEWFARYADDSPYCSVQLFRKCSRAAVADTLVFGDFADNAAIAACCIGAKVNTVVIDRTFAADGGCYSLCLPFPLTADDIATAFKGAAFYEFAAVSVSGNRATFNFRKVEKTAAGTPYIMVPRTDGAGDIVCPELNGKRILSAEARRVAYVMGGNTYAFQGIFNATPLPANGTVCFVSRDGKRLVTPNADGSLRGLRAYFALPDATFEGTFPDSAETPQLIVTLGDNTTDAERASATVPSPTARHAVYGIDGRHIGWTVGQRRTGVCVSKGRLVVIGGAVKCR